MTASPELRAMLGELSVEEYMAETDAIARRKPVSDERKAKQKKIITNYWQRQRGESET